MKEEEGWNIMKKQIIERQSSQHALKIRGNSSSGGEELMSMVTGRWLIEVKKRYLDLCSNEELGVKKRKKFGVVVVAPKK